MALNFKQIVNMDIIVRIDYTTNDNQHRGSKVLKWNKDHTPQINDNILLSGITKNFRHLTHSWSVTKRTWEAHNYLVIDIIGINGYK